MATVGTKLWLHLSSVIRLHTHQSESIYPATHYQSWKDFQKIPSNDNCNGRIRPSQPGNSLEQRQPGKLKPRDEPAWQLSSAMPARQAINIATIDCR